MCLSFLPSFLACLLACLLASLICVCVSVCALRLVKAEYFHYMKSYSPVNNIVHQDYPAILVTAGLHDPRVQYWEPMK